MEQIILSGDEWASAEMCGLNKTNKSQYTITIKKSIVNKLGLNKGDFIKIYAKKVEKQKEFNKSESILNIEKGVESEEEEPDEDEEPVDDEKEFLKNLKLEYSPIMRAELIKKAQLRFGRERVNELLATVVLK